jgi:hypothetical protein
MLQALSKRATSSGRLELSPSPSLPTLWDVVLVLLRGSPRPMASGNPNLMSGTVVEVAKSYSHGVTFQIDDTLVFSQVLLWNK